MTEAGADSTGVVGGFEGACAMDVTEVMICERCARSLPEKPWEIGAEGNSGRRV